MGEAVEAGNPSSETYPWKQAGLTVAGGTLLVMGLKRRTLPGYAVALAGGWMAYRGLSSGGGRGFEVPAASGPGVSEDAFEVQRTLTIGASAEDVTAFLREPANLDRVLGEVGDVADLGGEKQGWTLRTPTGHEVSWEMRLVDAGDHLRWESTEGAALPSEVAARTREAPGDRGTELTLEAAFEVPGGPVGTTLVERMDIVPYALLGQGLRRTKSLVETGEATLRSGPSGGVEDRP